MAFCEKLRQFFSKPSFPTPSETHSLAYRCGEPFYIEKYEKSDGFPYSCRSCPNPATAQYAVFNGVGEPQGSLYYCLKHYPASIDAVVTHYLSSMGYAN